MAIGEIKKTLGPKDIIHFQYKIKYLKEDMKRELIPNSVYEGQLNGNSTFFDMLNMRTDRKHKNPLFSFIFAIDVDNIDKLKMNDEYKYLPNDIYILNHSIFLAGKIENNRFIHQLEDEYDEVEGIIHFEKSGIVCLATLFNL